MTQVMAEMEMANLSEVVVASGIASTSTLRMELIPAIMRMLNSDIERIAILVLVILQ
jgi:shikimate kinase